VFDGRNAYHLLFDGDVVILERCLDHHISAAQEESEIHATLEAEQRSAKGSDSHSARNEDEITEFLANADKDEGENRHESERADDVAVINNTSED